MSVCLIGCFRIKQAFEKPTRAFAQKKDAVLKAHNEKGLAQKYANPLYCLVLPRGFEPLLPP